MANRFFLLVYDIPEGMGITNPSTYFRQFGARINLSCWIMPEASIPYPYLREMHRQGVKWEAVAFDPKENANLVRMAVQAIKAEIEAVRTRTRQSCDRASRQAENDTASVDTLKTFRKKAAGSLKKMRKAIRDLQAVSARFGVEGETTADLSQAENYCDNVKGMMLRRAQTLVESVRALEANNPNDGVAAYIRQITDPEQICIAADYIQDTLTGLEGERTANRLRNAFRTLGPGESYFD